MTPAGHTALKEELKRLKSVERPKIVKEIEEALAHGDLSENAEYKYAKEKQGFIEGRIREIDDKLARAEVVELRHAPEAVQFGCMVRALDLETDAEDTYIIVGQDEVDIKKRRISYESPIARALVNKRVGDVVEVNAPRGTRELEIVAIEIPPAE
jgi:transcription elongation factor GreA